MNRQNHSCMQDDKNLFTLKAFIKCLTLVFLVMDMTSGFSFSENTSTVVLNIPSVQVVLNISAIIWSSHQFKLQEYMSENMFQGNQKI